MAPTAFDLGSGQASCLLHPAFGLSFCGRGDRTYWLILRKDASHASQDVRGFILRVAGLVVIISIVVTGA